MYIVNVNKQKAASERLSGRFKELHPIWNPELNMYVIAINVKRQGNTSREWVNWWVRWQVEELLNWWMDDVQIAINMWGKKTVLSSSNK